MSICAMLALTLAASGCAGQPSGEDLAVIDRLGPIAVRDAELGDDGDAKATGVECWAPSQRMIDDARWRVLCRVHYELGGAERFRDVICIGESSREPVSDYCYRWAPYSDMPAFEDHPAFAGSAPGRG